jgi:hypothetical protein
VAIVSGEKILVQPKDLPAKLYRYDLSARKAQVLQGDAEQPELQKRLEAFLQIATQSLLGNTTGVADSPGSAARGQ